MDCFNNGQREKILLEGVKKRAFSLNDDDYVEIMGS